MYCACIHHERITGCIQVVARMRMLGKVHINQYVCLSQNKLKILKGIKRNVYTLAIYFPGKITNKAAANVIQIARYRLTAKTCRCYDIKPEKLFVSCACLAVSDINILAERKPSPYTSIWIVCSMRSKFGLKSINLVRIVLWLVRTMIDFLGCC